MLGFALVWLVELPFGVLDLWWQRRHHLSRVGYAHDLFGDWFALGGEFVFLCLALAIVMGFARKLGERWWIAAAPVFVGLALLFAFMTPYLTLDAPAARPGICALPRALRGGGARRARADRRRDVHDVTSLPNAEAMGIGPSRRVVLWDTLVDGRFTAPELEVVIAHELGHLARNHIWKAVGWYALFAFPGAFLIARATRRRGGMGAAGGGAARRCSCSSCSGCSRCRSRTRSHVTGRRRRTGWRCRRRTTRRRRPRCSVASCRRRSTIRTPRRSTTSLLENHPTIMQRIAMAQAWRVARRRRQPSRRRATCRARGGRAARRASPARSRGRARGRRSGRRRGSSRGGAR